MSRALARELLRHPLQAVERQLAAKAVRDDDKLVVRGEPVRQNSGDRIGDRLLDLGLEALVQVKHRIRKTVIEQRGFHLPVQSRALVVQARIECKLLALFRDRRGRPGQFVSPQVLGTAARLADETPTIVAAPEKSICHSGGIG